MLVAEFQSAGRDTLLGSVVTDAPLAPTDLDQAGLGQFPAVIGGVVPVVNVDGFTISREA